MKMNKWLLSGRLTEEPGLYFSESGNAVCSFTIVATSGFGKYFKKIYPQVVTFGKIAEAHAKNLAKGSKIIVVGEGYQKKNKSKGKTYYNLQVKAETIEYLSNINQNRPDTKDNSEYEPPALEDEDFDVPF
jgi:single-stranded DNA-binding protein